MVNLYRDDPQDWLCYDTLTGHGSTVWKLAFSPDGSELGTASADGTVKIWRMYPVGNPEGIVGKSSDPRDPAWACTCTIAGYHDREVYALDWAQNGLLATGAGDNGVRVFRRTNADRNAPSYELAASVADAHTEVRAVQQRARQCDRLNARVARKCGCAC